MMMSLSIPIAPLLMALLIVVPPVLPSLIPTIPTMSAVTSKQSPLYYKVRTKESEDVGKVTFYKGKCGSLLHDIPFVDKSKFRINIELVKSELSLTSSPATNLLCLQLWTKEGKLAYENTRNIDELINSGKVRKTSIMTINEINGEENPKMDHQNKWTKQDQREEEKLINGGNQDQGEDEKLINGGKQDQGEDEKLINGGKQHRREEEKPKKEEKKQQGKEEKPKKEGSGLPDTDKGFLNFSVSSTDKEKRRKMLLKRYKASELTTEPQIKKEMEKLEKYMKENDMSYSDDTKTDYEILKDKLNALNKKNSNGNDKKEMGKAREFEKKKEEVNMDHQNKEAKHEGKEENKTRKEEKLGEEVKNKPKKEKKLEEVEKPKNDGNGQKVMGKAPNDSIEKLLRGGHLARYDSDSGLIFVPGKTGPVAVALH